MNKANELLNIININEDKKIITSKKNQKSFKKISKTISINLTKASKDTLGNQKLVKLLKQILSDQERVVKVFNSQTQLFNSVIAELEVIRKTSKETERLSKVSNKLKKEKTALSKISDKLKKEKDELKQIAKEKDIEGQKQNKAYRDIIKKSTGKKWTKQDRDILKAFPGIEMEAF